MVKIKCLVVVLILFCSQIASACRCDGLNPKDAVDSSKAILIVYVVETKVKDIPANSYGYGGKMTLLEAKFKILETLKASKKPINIIRSIGSCGMPIMAGKKYYVSIPKESPIENLISVCTGSFQIWESDKSKIKELRQIIQSKLLKQEK
ncbi:hypothetical protein [Flocculibacter collagenilyticus]|uniref:hypothetical protein n=1 Tax=Flocculibacter collagenilyticus TaxID=2744479 RepID=UPI0018F43177|nr:hypothetical protein [Flocculibacter collagenilyticus]